VYAKWGKNYNHALAVYEKMKNNRFFFSPFSVVELLTFIFQ
jgi:hypothetical protein